MTTQVTNTKILLTRGDLPRLGIHLSNTTMLRLEAAGHFPKRVRLGQRSVAWLADEVMAHVEALASAREAA